MRLAGHQEEHDADDTCNRVPIVVRHAQDYLLKYLASALSWSYGTNWLTPGPRTSGASPSSNNATAFSPARPPTSPGAWASATVASWSDRFHAQCMVLAGMR